MFDRSETVKVKKRCTWNADQKFSDVLIGNEMFHPVSTGPVRHRPRTLSAMGSNVQHPMPYLHGCCYLSATHILESLQFLRGLPIPVNSLFPLAQTLRRWWPDLLSDGMHHRLSNRKLHMEEPDPKG